MPLSFFKSRTPKIVSTIAAVPGRHLGPLSLKGNPPSPIVFRDRLLACSLEQIVRLPLGRKTLIFAMALPCI